ncbi:MAG: hypothetical protein IPI79_00500 [Moraxellaceae bacterium]|nr:hypothetical protein [Moraxellaceae bacterium]
MMTDTNQKSDTTKSGLTGLMDKVKDSVTSALDTTKEAVAEKAHQAKDYLKDDLEKTKADAQNITETVKEKLLMPKILSLKSRSHQCRSQKPR